ncbi:MAG: SGNH/GDSL hydrolase family protein [Burkholderiaceae bacterium]
MPPPRLADTPQVIDYYGDSTIWGWDPASDGQQVETTAPEVFATALPFGHTVNNLGVNGQTACELLNGDGNETWATRVRNRTSTTVLILNHGINDAVSSNAVPVATYSACLTQLAQIAKSQGKRVIFETPNPIADSRLASYVTAMRAVAAQEGLSLIDQYAYLISFYGPDTFMYVPDGMHPSQGVYIEKGHHAANVFRGFAP